MFDVFTQTGILDPSQCRRIIVDIRNADDKPALVYGRNSAGAVDLVVRKAMQADVSSEAKKVVEIALESAKPLIERHFCLKLSGFEEPQFLHYRTGDHFVAHQDGNTPLIYDDTRFRKVSVVIFLNEPSGQLSDGDYEGGRLVLHGKYPDYDLRHPIRAVTGAMAAFKSETTHEVETVTRGERYTIVSWFRE